MRYKLCLLIFDIPKNYRSELVNKFLFSLHTSPSNEFWFTLTNTNFRTGRSNKTRHTTDHTLTNVRKNVSRCFSKTAVAGTTCEHLCFSLLCFIKYFDVVNLDLQISHLKDFFTLWIATRWLAKVDIFLYVLLQISHWYGLRFVLLCSFRMCFVKVVDSLNILWQPLHSYGFSPVWILLWAWRFPSVLTASPQMSHLNNFLWEPTALIWSDGDPWKWRKVLVELLWNVLVNFFGVGQDGWTCFVYSLVSSVARSSYPSISVYHS